MPDPLGQHAAHVLRRKGGIMGTKLIELINIHKSFGEHEVLSGIDLYIRENEFITLLGPSGCGKTTTLRLIGGFERPELGDIVFDGKRINDVPPYKRHINTVFQRYALFPHLDVFENVAFGLRIQKRSKEEIAKRVSQILKLVDLRGFEGRHIDSLSGGQQQRVAIARALINKPRVLLLDEPLGALDMKLRREMQIELKNMQRQVGITFIYVTHDQEEALTMSDTVVVMNGGRIQQIGTPEDIYNEPSNRFVAYFIGKSNIIEGTMLRDREVKFCGQVFPCVDAGFAQNAPVDVVLRPEDIRLGPAGEGQLQGMVSDVVFKGIHYEMMIDCRDVSLVVQNTRMMEKGAAVGLSVVPQDIHVMVRGGGA
jgi:spermidine/putrescine transport system ATP-binding protein